MLWYSLCRRNLTKMVVFCALLRSVCCLGDVTHEQTLFLLMGDVELGIRLDALSLLGRLARRNPANLLPPLRETLMHILVELQFNRRVESREEATKMLCRFLRSPALQALVHPFVRTVIIALPLKVGSCLMSVVARSSPLLHGSFPLVPPLFGLLSSTETPSPAYTYPKHLENNVEGNEPHGLHNLQTDDHVDVDENISLT